MIWLLAALVGSVVTAHQAELNRIYQQCGYRLTLWRTKIVAIIWAPLAFLQPWPTDMWFYAAAIFGGVGMLVGSTITSNLAATHNGRVAVLHMPLKALLVFVVWTLIHPPALDHLLERPERLPLVMLCLAVMGLALMAFRHNDASWGSLKKILPVVLIYAANDLSARVVLPPTDLQAKLIVFLFVMSLTCALTALLLWPLRPRKPLPFANARLIEASALAATGSVVNHVCFFVALVLAPNPAYVSMLLLLAPVWLLMWHRLRGVKDDANPWAGTLLVLAALVLMVVVA